VVVSLLPHLLAVMAQHSLQTHTGHRQAGVQLVSTLPL
jgi:hypothetical protein